MHDLVHNDSNVLTSTPQGKRLGATGPTHLRPTSERMDCKIWLARSLGNYLRMDRFEAAAILVGKKFLSFDENSSFVPPINMATGHVVEIRKFLY